MIALDTEDNAEGNISSDAGGEDVVSRQESLDELKISDQPSPRCAASA